MNNIPAVQRPIRSSRLGSCVAIVLGLFACFISVGVWYLFARDGLTSLVDSVSLQFLMA